MGPNAAMLTQDGKLTDIGSWYLGGAATNNVPSGAGRECVRIRVSLWAGVLASMLLFLL